LNQLGNDPGLDAALKRGIAAVDREDYQAGLMILGSYYRNDPEGVPDGLSYYALCLAMLQRKNKEAIKMCENAIDRQFYQGAHYTNLVKIHLASGNRKRGVEVLERGMKRLPKDQILLSLRDAIGYRLPPPIRFLHRKNFLNVHLGKRRARRLRDHPEGEEEESNQKTIIFWTLLTIGVIVYFFFLIWLFFSIVD